MYQYIILVKCHDTGEAKYTQAYEHDTIHLVLSWSRHVITYPTMLSFIFLTWVWSYTRHTHWVRVEIFGFATTRALVSHAGVWAIIKRSIGQERGSVIGRRGYRWRNARFLEEHVQSRVAARTDEVWYGCWGQCSPTFFIVLGHFLERDCKCKRKCR